MPRPNLRRAQALAAEFCASRGVPYAQTSLLGSHVQVLGHLTAIGRLTKPPMISQGGPVAADPLPSGRSPGGN